MGRSPEWRFGMTTVFAVQPFHCVHCEKAYKAFKAAQKAAKKAKK
jgi:hypothetical protein